MARRKRQSSTFNLSFLDIMSCGFGAVVLVFLIIDHSLEVEIRTVNAEVLSEVELLEEDIREGEEGLVRLRNALDEADLEIVEADGLARRITEELDEYEALIASIEESGVTDSDALEKIKGEIYQFEEQVEELKKAAQEEAGRSARDFLGAGNRQYLTGLNLSGKRVLIFLDASASMLANTILDIYLLKGESPAVRRKAEKWTRAIRTVEWVLANLNPDSSFQLIVFNETAITLDDNRDVSWIKARDTSTVDPLLEKLKLVSPHGGTNLYKAVEKLNELKPSTPDNIFLITDGFPTQGKKPLKPDEKWVSASQRRSHLRNAASQLGRSVPINIILFPIEGEYYAAPDYWELAQRTAGSFMIPAENWP